MAHVGRAGPEGGRDGSDAGGGEGIGAGEGDGERDDDMADDDEVAGTSTRRVTRRRGEPTTSNLYWIEEAGIGGIGEATKVMVKAFRVARKREYWSRGMESRWGPT